MYKIIPLILLFLFSTVVYSKGTNVFGLGVYDIKLGLANLDDIESYAVQVGMRFSL